jgi:hypothetical protein
VPLLNFQCLFVSEALPCDFCQSKNLENPCIKLSAPKRRVTVAGSNIPSPPLVPIEESLTPDDTHVLNFVYSHRITLNAAFISQIAIAFGHSIRPTPLRYAILAYGYLNFPRPGRLERFEAYAQLASNALLRRIKSPELLQDADCFAAMLLAYSCMVKGATVESVVHAGGCVAILQHLYRRRRSRPYSDILTMFAPFTIDQVTSILKMAEQPFPLLDFNRPPFAERRTYYQLLCKTGCPTAWLPGDTEATYNHLRGTMAVSLGMMKTIATLATRGSANNADKIRLEREELISYLHRKLDDPGFQQTFKALRYSLC